jgi:hypothetical protein
MEYDAADDLLMTLLPRTGGRPYAFGAGVLSPGIRRVENYLNDSLVNFFMLDSSISSRQYLTVQILPQDETAVHKKIGSTLLTR